jgi:LysM repeat protein
MNPNINENDRTIFSSHLDESLSKNISVIALIASMLAIPDVTNAKNLTQDLKTIPIEELKISNPLVTKFINKNANIKKEYGGGEYKLSYSNLINLLATIAYNEGMEDYISPNTKGKKYDERALTCPLWTIINRAGGDANKFAEKILEPSQYYSMKHIINGRNLKNYKTYHPGVGYSKRTWDKCNELAKKAINGTLPMPVDDNGVEFGKRNMIANKKKDNKKSYEAWGENCIFSLGGKTKNSYGYESCHDGWKDAKTIHTNTHKEASSNNFTMYEVKRGDTITQLSKQFKTTKEKILKLNKTIKDGNKIYPGQKIKIPKT